MGGDAPDQGEVPPIKACPLQSQKCLVPFPRTHLSPSPCAHFPIICSIILQIGSELPRLMRTILHFKVD